LASVAVKTGGEAIAPAGVSCAGTIGRSKLSGAPSATAGKATCRYRTPKRAKHKVLRGTIAFSAAGTKVSRQFAVKLH
jgi:hypothetical protein